MNRRFNYHMAQQVAMCVTTNALDALATQTEYFPRLRFRRNLDLGDGIQRRYFNFATQRGRSETDRHFAVQVILFALENRVRFEVDLHVEIARGTSVDTVLTLAGKPYAISLVNACRNLYR